MQQIDQSLQITSYQSAAGSQLVKVGDRVFTITEIQSTAIQPNSSVAPYPNGFWDSFKWLAVGLVGMGFFALLAYSIARMFAPVPAPTPQIIIQSTPEKKPFTRRECRADGLFGWGESCTEERGYE